MLDELSQSYEILEPFSYPYDMAPVDEDKSFSSLEQALARCDLAVFHRLILPVRHSRLLSACAASTVFDYDDALYAVASNHVTRDRQEWVGYLRRAYRLLTRGHAQRSSRYRPLRSMLRACKAVSAGSPELASFAKKENEMVSVVPTVVDVENFPIKSVHAASPVTIGWYGSPDNHAYLRGLLPVFETLRRRFADRVRFALICSEPLKESTVPIDWIPWVPEREREDLLQFDIGIMPLTFDLWAAGKCGNKALYYMAAGISTVVSPVGVNATIVDHGQNGFWASSQQQWVESLAQLVESAELRQRLGAAARNSVLQNYSRPVALAKFKAVLASCPAERV